MRKLLPLMMLLCCSGVSATTRTAANCTQAAVQTTIGLSSTGDTVLIPQSSCPGGVTWGTNTTSDTPLTITNVGIILNGQGVQITDNELKGDSNCGHTTSLISVSESTNVFVQITNMTIIGIAPSFSCGESANHIHIDGFSHQFRVDHITFNPPEVTGVSATSDSWGVIDHCTYNYVNNNVFAANIHHDAWQGVGSFGDNSWAQADTFGQAGAVYIETNTYNYVSSPSAAFPTGCFDEESGGRVVFRFNTGCPFDGMHGLDSSARLRSGRSYEIYNNTFTAVKNNLGNMYTAIFLRGGTGFIFNNNFNDVTGSPYLQLTQITNYRSTNSIYPPWGNSPYSGNGVGGEGCDGRSAWDNNDATVYATGTVGASSTNQVMTASGSPGWTTNQWAPSGTIYYYLVDTTIPYGSVILSNTSGTITVTAPAQTATGFTGQFNNGDAFQIRRAYPCMDQVGRGAGTYISGNPPNVTPVGWPTQASDPLYEWLNQHNSSTVTTTIFAQQPVLVQNRDFYDYQTTGCTGTQTTGVCSDVLGNRAPNCTTGVGFWATDQGNWNSSGSGGQGQFYLCTATNTWTLQYTPYTYPHPLVGGGGTCANPTIVPASELFFKTFSATITAVCTSIIYTTNGTTPTADSSCNPINGSTYTTPVSISATTVLSAIACQSGMTTSGTATAVYSLSTPAPSIPMLMSYEIPNYSLHPALWLP